MMTSECHSPSATKENGWPILKRMRVAKELPVRDAYSQRNSGLVMELVIRDPGPTLSTNPGGDNQSNSTNDVIAVGKIPTTEAPLSGGEKFNCMMITARIY